MMSNGDRRLLAAESSGLGSWPIAKDHCPSEMGGYCSGRLRAEFSPQKEYGVGIEHVSQ
jgi:hypothetical protein